MLWSVLAFLLLILACERTYDYGSLSRIDWRRDFKEALSEAQRKGKPVFIYFSAVWCSWCREYEKELEKEEVVRFLEENFIPLLLDSDRDRSLFLEFGGRGTPFTVVLDPRRIPILKFHGAVRSKDLIEVLTATLEGKVSLPEEGKTYRITQLEEETYRFLFKFFLEDLRERYDPIYGGFSSPSARGSLFKWSTPLTYDYLLEKGIMVEEVLFSLRKDIEFLYDEVDGGFFNFFDRTRAYDFYFETSKTLSVNSLMIIALLEAYRVSGEELFLQKAIGTYDYMRRTLRTSGGCFLNAQISDPSYYNLPPEKRRRRKPPPTDTAIIVEDNSKAIMALIELYRITGEGNYLKEALECADYILGNMLKNGTLYRFYDVRTENLGLPNFGRDVAFFSLALLEISHHRQDYREELLKVLGIEPKEDWVSRSLLAYVLARVDRKRAEEKLLGTEVDLSYQNPDELVFLLRAFEALIERGSN